MSCKCNNNLPLSTSGVVDNNGLRLDLILAELENELVSLQLSNEEKITVDDIFTTLRLVVVNTMNIEFIKSSLLVLTKIIKSKTTGGSSSDLGNYRPVVIDGDWQEKYRPSTDGKGFKVLDSAKSLESQMTDDNFIYVILNNFELTEDTIIPEDCILRFDGGMISGHLVGNNTTIEAGAFLIFDTDIEISGTFANEYAYPEWWGAVATKTTTDSEPNCRAAIQAALDSIFGEIRFCPGFYYVGDPVNRPGHELASLYLNYTKTLKLSGNSHNYKARIYDGTTSVIWTNLNNNILLVNIQRDFPILNTPTLVARTNIIGGEFNASKCNNFSNSAILVYPSGTEGLRIETSVCGPLGDLRTNGVINWNNVHLPTKEEMDNGYMGYGIRFTNNINISTIKHCYISTINSYIYGFGTGFAVQYRSNPNLPNTSIGELASMTSTELRGYIDNCFRYVYVPHRAFNGGVIECVIQTRKQNAPDGFTEPIIQGNFTEAYLDPYIWDLYFKDNSSKSIDALRFSSNTRNVRIGQRLLSVIRSCYRSYGFGDNPDDPTRFDGIKSLSKLTSVDSGSSMSAFGNFDLNAMGGSNAVVQSANYTHIIDNDLLSIDSMISGFITTITNSGFVPRLYTNINNPNTSLFDRDGLEFMYTTDSNVSSTDKWINIKVNFPSACRKPLAFLAMHLKGSAFNYFKNLKVDLKDDGGTEYTLYDSSYADLAETLDSGHRDIILPFIFKKYQLRRPVYINIKFSNYVAKSNFEKNNDNNIIDFKFSMEGRYFRHYKNHVFTSGGGDIGKSLTKYGKLFIGGTKTYSKMSDLPADAANGAITTVGGGTTLTNYPVVKTKQGWMVQGLTGNTQLLNSILTTLDNLSVGQAAFDISTNKPVWWDGSSWIDTIPSSVYEAIYEIETLNNNKLDLLVSGTNIKTINGESLLGSGNIDIQSGGETMMVVNVEYDDRSETYTADKTYEEIVNAIDDGVVVEALYDVQRLQLLSLAGNPPAAKFVGIAPPVGGLRPITTLMTSVSIFTSNTVTVTIVPLLLYLESGTNIKTINGESLLGSGNIKTDMITIASTIPNSGASPNVCYNLGTTDSVNITLDLTLTGEMNVWRFIFTALSSSCLVTLPNDVVLANGYTWDMLANRKFFIKIVDNVAFVDWADLA